MATSTSASTRKRRTIVAEEVDTIAPTPRRTSRRVAAQTPSTAATPARTTRKAARAMGTLHAVETPAPKALADKYLSDSDEDSHSHHQAEEVQDTADSDMPEKACVVIRAPGGYEQLHISPLETRGTIGPNVKAADTAELVLVRTHYVGVNYADVCVRWGLYESAKKFVGFPITPGFEFAGVVEEVGPAVHDLRVGDAVFGVSLFGSYSTHVLVPRRQLFKRPASVPAKVAAAIPAVYLTAHYAIFHVAHLEPGSTILVHSAAGGVGSALAQIAKILACTVIGVVGAAHKVPAATAAGCDHIIDKSTQELWSTVKRLAPRGLHAIFDANGTETLAQGFEHLAPEGKLVVYGFHTMLPKRGGVLTPLSWLKIAWDFVRLPRFSPLEMTATNRSVMGFNLSFLFDRVDILQQAMDEMLEYGSI